MRRFERCDLAASDGGSPARSLWINDVEENSPTSTNSAFIGTDLTVRLDRSACAAVVFVGVITNNSLEATVRSSHNLGYRSFVVAGGCWTVELVDMRRITWVADDVHALLLANMHGEYATVISSHELVGRND